MKDIFQDRVEVTLYEYICELHGDEVDHVIFEGNEYCVNCIIEHIKNGNIKKLTPVKYREN